MKFTDVITELQKKMSVKTANPQAQNRHMVFRGIRFIFPDGIYFKCMNCGNCCTGEDIPLDPNEVNSGIFKTKEGSKVSISYSGKFIDKKMDEPCPCRKDGRCSVYDKRPQVCRKYPWEFIYKPEFIELTVCLIIDNLDNGFACKGFHVGKMKFEHLKPFVPILKKNQRLANEMDSNKEVQALMKSQIKKQGNKPKKMIESWCRASGVNPDVLKEHLGLDDSS